MKNRAWKKGISLLLVFIALCSTAACGGEQNSDWLDYFGNKTVFSEKETYLVEKTQSEYTIVIETDADDNEITASRELKSFFAEATGVELPVKTDDQAVFSSNAKYISIGDTSLAESAGVTADVTELKEQGYRIKTVDNSVFLLGATSIGSLYAVYDFLHYEVGYEYFFTDVYALDRNVANLKLKEYDVKEVPDIDMMTTPSVGVISANNVNMRRFRMTQQSDWLIPIYGNLVSVHNVFLMLDPNKFLSEHKAWYSDDIAVSEEDGKVKGQLCFSAHGIPEQQEAMFNEIVSIVKTGLQTSEATVFSISQNDYNTFCDCQACLDAKNKYGANSALLILLCNKLSDYFADWFETEEGSPYKRDIKFMFLAYQQILEAPVTLNASGEYEANDLTLRCNDNVGVYFAPDSFNATYGFEQATNAGIFEEMKAWKALTDKFMYWVYDANVNHYFIPYDSFYSKQEFYQFMADAGTFIVNDQAQTQNRNNSTAWGNVKSYLSTKLRWDVNADLSVLTKQFFKTCYLDAYDEMYSVYLQYKAHWQEMKRKMADGEYSSSDEGLLGNIFGALNQGEFWPKNTVESWYKTFKKAIAIIDAKRGTDPAYENAYKMIAAELVSPLYMMLTMHGDSYSDKEAEILKKEFKEYCTVAGILKYKDSSSKGHMQEVYDSLGII